MNRARSDCLVLIEFTVGIGKYTKKNFIETAGIRIRTVLSSLTIDWVTPG